MEKLSWHTLEYLHTEKTSDWYWIVGIITVTIAVIAIIMNNIIFAILILVASFTLSLFASRKPRVIEISLDGSGITVGRTKYPYNHIESFWVETRNYHPRLLLKSKKFFMPYLVILIDEEVVHPDEIRAFLLNHLHEEEHSEPFLEKLLVYLGF
jgi:hypothetical protein